MTYPGLKKMNPLKPDTPSRGFVYYTDHDFSLNAFSLGTCLLVEPRHAKKQPENK